MLSLEQSGTERYSARASPFVSSTIPQDREHHGSGRRTQHQWARLFPLSRQPPEGQKGIPYRKGFLILCNPMPVFSPHFTIATSTIAHKQSSMVWRYSFGLIVDFGGAWTIMYTVSKCGASAPESLSSPGCPFGTAAVEEEIRPKAKTRTHETHRRRHYLSRHEAGTGSRLLQAVRVADLERAFSTYVEALRKVLLQEEEPMINVIGFADDGDLRVLNLSTPRTPPGAFFSQVRRRLW